MMHRLLILLALSLASATAVADDAASCRAGAGTFLSGVVVKAPRFAHGRYRRGIELSHTHLRLREDGSGRVYDVAIDNVFASGYDRERQAVPAPINQIAVNDRLELCGALYSKGQGIHWVHPNCRGRPDPRHPDGWLKRLGANGMASPNLESNLAYCRIF
jgi:hypothetical protein